MPAYPGQSTATRLTTDVMLKNPRLISRRLVDLTTKLFAADKLLIREDASAVAGGAMRYQRDESIFLDDDPETGTTPRARWKRTGWSEDVRTANVSENGLEVVLNNLSIRRNLRSQREIALRKLANNIVRFVDSAMFDLLEGDPDVLTGAASAVWTTAGTDIIKDIAKAQEDIELQYNGYNGFENAVLVLHPKRRDDLLNNTVLRAALPREKQDGQIQTGDVVPFLGLSDIVYSSQITETLAILMDPTVAGVIADEEPDPEEGFVAESPGEGRAPIWVKVYKEEPKDTVIAGARWPAMALVAPKAVRLITSIA